MMHIQFSDPTNADPITVDGSVEWDHDDSECTVSVPITSPVYARLSMSGLRTYTLTIDTGPNTEWRGTMTRFRPGGNTVFVYATGQTYIDEDMD